ncbi:thiamine diphosphokinase [Oceanobacillus sp. CAU 1775]
MEQLTIGVVANGPEHLIPDLSDYKDKVDVWIGADRGALHLLNNNLTIDYALGDFDSVTTKELARIEEVTENLESFPSEKDETDVELAIRKASELGAKKLLLFGVTGARIDHELINIQLLSIVHQLGIKGIIIDIYNSIEWTTPGEHSVFQDTIYETISFIPVTEEVIGLTLKGFYYPLDKATVNYGSTRTISNKLTEEKGTFSYDQGILLLIKSRDIKE